MLHASEIVDSTGPGILPDFLTGVVPINPGNALTICFVQKPLNSAN
jgi:hypothetical protein